MWTKNEVFKIQRFLQTHGRMPWEDMKNQLGSNKSPQQLKVYFASLMSNVEYLVRVEMLKDLLRNNRVPIPQPWLDKYKPKYEDIHSRSTNLKNAGTVIEKEVEKVSS